MDYHKPKFLPKIILATIIFIAFSMVFATIAYLTKNKQAVNISQQVSSLSQPTIFTDKTIYNQGEMIKITLKNNTTKSIFYNKIATCGLYFEEIQKQENSKWTGAIWDFPCLEMWKESNEIVELKPKQEDSISRKYSIGENYIGGGIFRFSFKYRTTKENQEENIIYSNKITINEKVLDYDLQDISRWKTFKEDRLGFEFHYPESIKNIKGVAFSSGYFLNIDLNGLTEDTIIPLQTNEFDMTIKKYDKKDIDNFRKGLVENSEKQISIDGLSGTQFKAMEISPYISQIAIFEKNNKIYVFKGEGKFFDAILSTFKFGEINPQLEDFSHWVRYNNKEYGFEFEYPDYLSLLRENKEEIRFTYGQGIVVVSPVPLIVGKDKIDDYKCEVGKTQEKGISPNIIRNTCDKIESENNWEIFKITSRISHYGETNIVYNLIRKKQNNNFTVFVISVSELNEDRVASSFKLIEKN